MAGTQDTLALLRTVILLARSFRASMRLDILQAWRTGQRREASCVEIHFGTAPCSALLLGLLESVERRLGDSTEKEGVAFLVQVEMPQDSRPIVVRISRDERKKGNSK